MVTDVYSHILDDDRRINAQRFEEAFYRKENPAADSITPATPQSTPPASPQQEITDETMLNYMLSHPDFLQKFKVLLGIGS